MVVVKATMAGTVWKVLVQEGQKVESGENVVILESMKMEIPIATEETGVVVRVVANEGDFINVDDVLVEMK